MKPYRSESDLDRPPKRRVWPWVVLLIVVLGAGAWFIGPLVGMGWNE